MLLNRFEFMLMNSPLRAFVMDKYEVLKLRDMSEINNIDIVLEIGCGNGNDSKLLKKYFSPEKLICIDLDERMINNADKKTMAIQ